MIVYLKYPELCLPIFGFIPATHSVCMYVWITPEIIDMKEEKRKYKNSNNVKHQQGYKTLKKLIIRKSKEGKEKYLEENKRK